MKYLLTIVLSFILSGCMASNFNEMTKDEDIKKQTFSINQNYQQLYKRGLSKIEECHEQGIITAAITSSGQIYTDIGEAKISIYMMGGFGKQMHNGITFKSTGEETTDLTIYTYFNKDMLNILKKETTGECKNCFCEDE